MKILLEIIDDQGIKNVKEFEGKPGKEHIKRFIEALEALEYSFQTQKEKPLSSDTTEIDNETLTIKERLELFLRYDYPRVWFTSLDVKRQYEKIFDDKINLSTVSTYLARMYRNNILERRGNRTQREYKIVEGDEAESSRVELVDKGYFKVGR